MNEVESQSKIVKSSTFDAHADIVLSQSTSKISWLPSSDYAKISKIFADGLQGEENSKDGKAPLLFLNGISAMAALKVLMVGLDYAEKS